ncbi:glycohydrolase toxin TNT-related protein [Actinomadura kijaniata]|uniref:glycohydrolase toxin TNT-related protein n=1 Tax=Actinomadura kijaniata TaxID=46161 RepID=UPI001C3F411D|nr:glycohydrolase toxin TNT-related protein [Actinomadura kijaniata]
MAEQNGLIEELERRIARLVRSAAPPEWTRADLHCRANVATREASLSAHLGESRIAVVEGVPEELGGLLDELRRACYRSEEGTWFSVVFFVEPSGFQVLYNRQFDPGWEPPIPEEWWRRDQVVMPRDVAHVPGWLRDRMEGREPSPGAGDVPALGPVEQAEVLSEGLAGLVADQAPPLWEKVFGYYQAAGGHVELPPLMVALAGGRMEMWTPPPSVATLLERLRGGTHAFQGDTWSRIDFEVLYEHGGVRCRAGFVYDEEPAWSAVPSGEDVRRELERHPRERVPEWMRRVLGAATEPPAGGFRKARVFDHSDPESGRPVVTRPAVPWHEVEDVVAYLRHAPVVLGARSLAPDRVEPERGERVPLTFHTDGTWVWSGAVGYYLEQHGVPPEADLVAHIRARGFRVPEVSDAEREAARAAATGGRDAPAPMTIAEPVPSFTSPSAPMTMMDSAPAAGRAPSVEFAPAPEAAAEPVPAPMTMVDSAPAARRAPSVEFAPQAVAEPVPEAGGASDDVPAPGAMTMVDSVAAAGGAPGVEFASAPEAVVESVPAPMAMVDSAAAVGGAPAGEFASAPETIAEHVPVPEAGGERAAGGGPADEPVAGEGRGGADGSGGDFKVAPVPAPATTVAEGLSTAVSLGAVPETLVDDGEPLGKPTPTKVWLTRLDRKLEELGVDPARYRVRGTAEDAWCLVVEDGRWVVFYLQDGERHHATAFEEPGQAVSYLLGSVLLRRPGSPEPKEPSPAPEEEERIGSLPGEPPLSLFRERRIVELPAGTRVDRHGSPAGNVVYIARTPFPHRSLPPDWEERPYHVYRTEQPLRVLTGTAVPWFGQPGGGVAYVLPCSVAELLADGFLVEGEAP